jgi:membrane protease YdiL (CAAX protease family)
MRRESILQTTNRFLHIFVLTLFPLILLAFDFRFYSFIFITILILLLLVPFLPSEKSRMLIWSFNVFLISLLLILYGFRIIENLPFPPNVVLLLGECIQLVPIFLLVYVLKKFSQSILIGLNHLHGISKKHQLILIFATVILIICLFFINSNSISLTKFSWALGFCVLHSFLYETLWRGIILELFKKFLGFFWANILISISFGIYIHSIGFPLYLSILFSILSLGLSILKQKTNSLFPSVLVHLLILLTLFISEKFFIPV